MSEEFVLQLIQKSLRELGYDAISEDLGDAIKLKRGTKTSLAEAAGWFLLQLKQGQYEAVEAHLEALLTASLPSPVLDLPQFRDPHAVVLTTLYLVKKTHFFEQLVQSPNKPQQQLLEYLRNQLLPLLDKLQARVTQIADSEFDFGHGSELNLVFDSLLLNQLNRESESALLLEFTTNHDKLTLVLASKYFFGQPIRSGNLITSARTLLTDTLLGKLLKNDKQMFDTSYDIPDNLLNTIIRQSVLYQKLQNAYYLPPRTSGEGKKRSDDEDLALTLDKSATQLHELYKTTLFPNNLLHTLKNHNFEVWCAKFSPLGRFLVTGALNGELAIYDVWDGFKLLKTLEPSTLNTQGFQPTDKRAYGEKSVIYCAWDQHEHYLVSCYLDTVVRVWEVTGLQQLTTKKRITRSMNDATTGEIKLASSFVLGQDIKTWTCEFLPTLDDTSKPRFIIGSPDKALKAYDVDGTELFDFYGNIDDDGDEETHDLNMKEDSPIDTAVEFEASLSSSAKNKLDNGLDKKLENNFNRINDIAVTPNGKILVTASNDRRLQFYQIPTSFNEEASTKRLASITLKGRLTSCSISANGKYLLVNCAPEELQVWDISGLSNLENPEPTPILYRRLLGHTQSIHVVRSAFGYLVDSTGEEELVISGSDDGFIYYWKLHTGQLIGRIKGHHGLCNSVDWNRFGGVGGSTDYGKLWCSVGDDKLVKIWGP
ncbi:WD40 repeat-like protein [Suhomyces tanzawaensis NRRL Y-17324]|uniref:WD40 repeat-like protein n=1 Tax=Suhomyces tanzawaensis NRRL Y-17324 TaxID=984487 RepID=A0A1E4SM31_9ASCO|nr:WD40 repeat-like protein [Suhomyces tanzawaensis NRRL Y-17324]ODV80586.1 WD40 repeat-like protein [Suhomyces tanzawaensis NRRL Y-17324]